MKSRHIILAGAALLVLAAPVLLVGDFSYGSYCGRCGEGKTASDTQLRFTRLTLWRRSATFSTPLSRVVQKHHLVTEAAHQFQFATGGGNGVCCALGPGRYLRETANSQAVADLIDGLATYRSSAEAQAWLALFLEPDRGQVRWMAVRDLAVPLTSRAEFERWWKATEPEINRTLAIYDN